MSLHLDETWKRNFQALPLEDQPKKIVMRKEETELLLQKEEENNQYKVKQILNLN